MLNRFVAIAGTVAVSFGVGLAAETQRGNTPASQTPTKSPASAAERKVNVDGCVFPKRAMSAGAPVNVPKGTPEDYVLTDVKVISASPGVTVPDGKVFKLDQVDQDTLRGLAGKRAGVSGRVDEKPDPAELQVISIIETVGSCPVPRTSHS